jgi:hypothetical protein
MTRVFQIGLTGKVGPQKNFLVEAEHMGSAIDIVRAQVKPMGTQAKVHSFGPWEIRLARFVGFSSEMLLDTNLVETNPEVTTVPDAPEGPLESEFADAGEGDQEESD